eukprot:125559_1
MVMIILPKLRFLASICVIVSIASGSIPGPLASAAFPQSIARSPFRKSKDRYTLTVHSNLLTVDPTFHEHYDKYQFTVPSALYDNVDRYSLYYQNYVYTKARTDIHRQYIHSIGYIMETRIHTINVCMNQVMVPLSFRALLLHNTRLQSHILWILFSGFMFFMIRTRLNVTKPTNTSTNIVQNACNITPYLPLIG